MKRATAKRRQKRALNKKPAFLAAVAVCGSVTEAAAATGIDRKLHYGWLRSDAAYPARYAEAKALGEDALEDEATNRAMNGVYVPNVYQGRFLYPQEEYTVTPAVGAVTALDWKEPGGPRDAVAAVEEVTAFRDRPGALPFGVWVKSDALLLARIRAAKPAYRQNAVELTGAGGGPVTVSLAEVIRDRRACRETGAE